MDSSHINRCDRTSWCLQRASKFTASICLVVLLLCSPLQAFAAAPVQETNIQTTCYAAQEGVFITCETDYAQGTLTLTVTGTERDVHLQLKHGDVVYGYHLYSNVPETIPLNMGNGEYQIKVLLYMAPTKGMLIWTTSLNIAMDDPLAPWLTPSRVINWTPDMELVEKAAALMVQNDQKATALTISNYIAKNYTYNSSITSLPSGYEPNLALLMKEKSGICYDFAALYAAMCRSSGIPCKLVKGYADYVPGVYHAWCEVYIEGQWLTVDPTYSISRGESIFMDSSQMHGMKYF